MTNPFATSTPKPELVSAELVAQANSRDYSANFLEFPDFEMEVPEITRIGGGRSSSGPAMPRDPEQAAILKALLTFEPLKQCKVIGFTRTGDNAIDEKTKTLASKVSLAARKHNLKVVSRTMAHPHDKDKPSHEQRHVIALWRGKDGD